MLKHTKVYTVPTLYLLRHRQHDTHEAWGQKVCKDRPQVDLVKTGFLFLGQSVFKLGGMVCRKRLHLAIRGPEQHKSVASCEEEI